MGQQPEPRPAEDQAVEGHHSSDDEPDSPHSSEEPDSPLSGDGAPEGEGADAKSGSKKKRKKASRGRWGDAVGRWSAERSAWAPCRPMQAAGSTRID